MITIIKKQNKSGFALILTLVIVSVVLAIGLSLLDITLKQLVLSSVGRDSEIAFHAAYAGAECAQYYRLHEGDDFIAGNAPVFTECLSGGAESGVYSSPVANVHLAQYEITWGMAPKLRCTEIDMYLYDASSILTTDIPNTLSYNIPFYGDPLVAESCNAEQICTVIVSRGYNRACGASLSSLRTVQREIVIKY